MKIESGWLTEARKVPSEHFNERPEDTSPWLLVVHNISLPPGKFGGPWIDQLFTGCLDPQADPYFKDIAELKVAAHCLIRRDGEIVQYVAFDKRAWHAGQSCYQGLSNCNDFSVGIELEGTDTLPYTEQQYQALCQLTRTLMNCYPIKSEHVTGHSDIAPGRKTDPGEAFDWHYYRQKLLAMTNK
ncbi:N-acetyl-anhydromuranmyl-L-alanine amidase [Tatumella morbirosei]|uniref:1,6-anhydro-N-acetylmuramyl-L-alanine amidase AmpD n=1 Tax=Tatumella morbirosei TaxID=642227 RepID=A0A095T0T0_9GAMM|nr:1,6-anhydro-N-acetylmuramyl-L-alanine amidase AmpD [Tatumella morbirosei]KGD70531.1 N-acetyl-anhydromuranmyl-L-alanine amidase [Tatumella morbirosei]